MVSLLAMPMGDRTTLLIIRSMQISGMVLMSLASTKSQSPTTLSMPTESRVERLAGASEFSAKHPAIHNLKASSYSIISYAGMSGERSMVQRWMPLIPETLLRSETKAPGWLRGRDAAIR